MLCICRLAHKKKHTLVSVLAEPCEVYHLSLDRGDIDLEISGMDYGSDRRFDCKAARIRYRMVYTDKLNRKNSEPDRVSGRNAPQLRFKIVAVLKEFVFENSERKLCSVNRNIYIS